MRKSMTTALLGAALAGVALLSLSAASWSRDHGGMYHDPERMVEHMTERLDLDEGQRNQVEQIISSGREQAEQYREELQSLREQLRAMREDFDPDTARSIADRIGVISGEMVYQAASNKAEIYGLLSEEQRGQMEAMMEKRGSRRGKWHRRGSDNPDEE